MALPIPRLGPGARSGKGRGKGKGKGGPTKSDVVDLTEFAGTKFINPITKDYQPGSYGSDNTARTGGGFDLTNVQAGPSFQTSQGGGSTVNPLTSTSLDYLKGEDITNALKLKQKNRRKGARSTE